MRRCVACILFDVSKQHVCAMQLIVYLIDFRHSEEKMRNSIESDKKGSTVNVRINIINMSLKRQAKVVIVAN